MTRLQSALAAISAVDRDVWLKVGFALHDLAAADPRWPGRALWDDWSKTYPKKFDPADQDKTWASFGRGYEGPRVTLATVFHLAQTNGWIDSSGAPPSAGAADAPARQSQADILIAIANRRAELFHAPDGTAYADIEVNWPSRDVAHSISRIPQMAVPCLFRGDQQGRQLGSPTIRARRRRGQSAVCLGGAPCSLQGQRVLRATST